MKELSKKELHLMSEAFIAGQTCRFETIKNWFSELCADGGVTVLDVLLKDTENIEKQNRFIEFSPVEQEIIRLLFEGHLNTVSSIANAANHIRIGEYLSVVEKLEIELMELYHKK